CRQHEGGVVLARLRAVDRVVFRRDDPVEVVVGAKLRKNLIADVDADRDEVVQVPLVGARDGDLEALRVRERIPTGDHVEPREQRRDHDQAEDDDHGHHARGGAPDVAAGQMQDVPHARSPPSVAISGMTDPSAPAATRVRDPSLTTARRSSSSPSDATSPARAKLCLKYSRVTSTPITSRLQSNHTPSRLALPPGTSQAIMPITTRPPRPAITVVRSSAGYRRVNGSARRDSSSRYSSRLASAWIRSGRR